MRLLPFVLGSLVASAFCSLATAEEKTFPVEAHKDITYYEGKDADKERHKLDVYVPKGCKSCPVLFFIHGGGWRKGSKDRFEAFGHNFAKKGIVVVNTNYRLTPVVKHPGHIQDVAKAFAWTVKNISKYGGDPDAIFVSGHSAGGHLAALLATNEKFLKAEQLSLKHIRGAIPISGVYEIPERLAVVFGDEASRKEASPIRFVSERTPPFLFLYAAKDIPNCDTLSKKMTELIKEKKGTAQWLMIPDRDHGSIVRNIPNDGDPTSKAMLDFIHKHAK
ncbi:MAG: hypothetical protein KatS3mg105_4484 [Gemmatales bacterium]|nr:MAG: hypothetical protein KatS3mg105_4484 [Gemmatales bacterium]